MASNTLREEVEEITKAELMERFVQQRQVAAAQGQETSHDVMDVMWVLLDSIASLREGLLRIADEVDALRASIR